MTPTRDQLRDQLRAVAARPAPLPRPEFVAGLGARLADGTTGISPVVTLRQPARRVMRPVLTGVAAAAAAVVLAGSFAGWFDGADESARARSLALASATDTVVVLPDGNQVLGTVGLELPDEAIVRTGPNGSATAGRTQLGPQQEAVVDAGQLRTRPPTVDPAATLTTVVTVPPTTARPVTTSTTVKRPGLGIPLTLPTLPHLPLPTLPHLPGRSSR
jgi:hypothetical protein